MTSDDLKALWQAQLAAAIDVYGAVAGDKALQENFAYSPASVSLALAMTSAGASGDALAHIEATMGFPAQGALHDLMAESTGALLEMNHEPLFPGQEGEVDGQQVNVVNSLWPQEGLEFKAPFLDEMSMSYDTGVYPVDYFGATEAARQSINGWVGDQTNDLIPELIPSGILSEDTQLTLVNAVYLKAPWASTFDAALTSDGVFFGQSTAGAVQRTVPYMRGTSAVSTAIVDAGELGTLQVVEIPYGHGDLSFVVVMPACANGEDCESATLPPVPASALPQALAAQLQQTGVSLSLPKFEIRSAVKLREAFEALGMTAPFNGGIDRIADQEFVVAEIVHEAFVTIDEKGTEAAAATAVVFEPTGVPETLVINRAFWFVIRDNALGIPLFIGFVADPS
ncbi:MAG: serpin family protein [Myxococcales bacterium]|nr:serpin family protein [Myxococcales bacterium]